ncbi:MAG: lysophospholipid acyltransferase family protein [Candidatus Cyclobacteriaceae bacterium M3_2C_046]
MMCLIPVKKEFKGNIKKDQNYIFCSNHFSYLDIPTMGLSPWYFKFTGKKSITRVPIFGYMFKNLHITVDRENQKGRYEAFYQYGKNLDQGVNLSIFPEGGIRSSQPPRMARFKHGPFKVAIEKQVPVVPVTLPFNWIILPDDGKFLLTWHVNKIIYHEPIETKGLSEKDTDALKDQVYKVIDQELRKQNNHEN